MRKIRESLKKEQIAGCKGYMRWFRFIDGELRLFLNEKAVNKNGKRLNLIYYKENKAFLCIDNVEYSNKFYEKYKDYDIRVFIKCEAHSLYNEYEIKSFNLCEDGLEILFT